MHVSFSARMSKNRWKKSNYHIIKARVLVFWPTQFFWIFHEFSLTKTRAKLCKTYYQKVQGLIVSLVLTKFYFVKLILIKTKLKLKLFISRYIYVKVSWTINLIIKINLKSKVIISSFKLESILEIKTIILHIYHDISIYLFL